MARAVAAHKAGHQLLRGDVQLVFGDVFEGDGDGLVVRRAFKIDARAGQSVFADIREEIAKNAGQKLAVGLNDRLRGREPEDRLELRGFELFHIIARQLADEDVHVRPRQMHRQAAGGRL